MFSVGACENPGVLKTFSFVLTLINIVLYLVPVVLILFITIDLAKNVISKDDKSNLNLIFKRIIGVVALFLVPTFVTVGLGLVSGNKKGVISSYNTCIKNMKNIDYYEVRYQALVKSDEERMQDEYMKKIANRNITYSIGSKLTHSDSSDDGEGGEESKGSVTPGQTYKLSDDEVRDLAAICIREQGNNVAGASAEASLIANLYEKKGRKYSSIREYVVKGGWFGKKVESKMKESRGKVKDEVFAAVKDVLVNGNRTLPLYVDEHDCWNCNSSNKCKNGLKGDICSLDTNGSTITSMDKIKNRSSYVKDKTVINNVYGSVYVFYTFPTSKSDPFGYTKSYYKKITGKEYGS